VASFVKGVATATTTSGDDIVISGLSNPVAVLLWTSKQTSAAALDGDGEFYMGLDDLRRRGGTAGLREVAASDTAKGLSTTACLKGYSNATPTVEFEYRGISMDATSIAIDQFDAPASAIKIHYAVFQAPGFTRALASVTVGSVAAATQDVTIASGFGKANLLFFMSNSTTMLGDSTNAPAQGAGAREGAISV
jgi:hypothetical protein